MRRVLVHHPVLRRELSVPERRVAGLLAAKSPWQLGPLSAADETPPPDEEAAPMSPLGDDNPPEEGDES